MFTWIFDSMLVPTWLHFGSQNRLKSFQKSIPRGINFLIDFYIDFLSILGRFWKPTWGHVGDFFDQNGGTLWGDNLFFVGSMLFFDLLVVLDPSWLHFGEVRGRFFDFLVDFGVDWLPFLTPSTSKIVKIQLVFVCFLDLGCFQDKLQNQKNIQKPQGIPRHFYQASIVQARRNARSD